MDSMHDIDAAFGGGTAAAPPVGASFDDIDHAFSAATPHEGPSMSASATAADVAKSAGSGVVRGVVGAPFALPSIGKLGAGGIVDGADWLVRKALGLGPESQETKDKQAAAAAHAASLAVPDVTDVGGAMQQALTPYLHAPESRRANTPRLSASLHRWWPRTRRRSRRWAGLRARRRWWRAAWSRRPWVPRPQGRRRKGRPPSPMRGWRAASSAARPRTPYLRPSAARCARWPRRRPSPARSTRWACPVLRKLEARRSSSTQRPIPLRPARHSPTR